MADIAIRFCFACFLLLMADCASYRKCALLAIEDAQAFLKNGGEVAVSIRFHLLVVFCCLTFHNTI